MDPSSVSMLSIEERQATEDLVIKAKRGAVQQHVNRNKAACKEHEIATAQKEAERDG